MANECMDYQCHLDDIAESAQTENSDDSFFGFNISYERVSKMCTSVISLLALNYTARGEPEKGLALLTLPMLGVLVKYKADTMMAPLNDNFWIDSLRMQFRAEMELDAIKSIKPDVSAFYKG